MRYWIFYNVWQHVIPCHFANNAMAVYSIVAMTVLGFYTNRIWKGNHGLKTGMPFMWVYSAEQNTGKTTV